MRIIVFFACLVFLANFSFANNSEILPLPKELRADEAPWFAFATEYEGTYSGVMNKDKLKELAKQKNSKRIVLTFYATWCVPCREGLKLMSNKAAELEKNGILVVLVNVGEEDYDKISKWVKKEYANEKWLLGFDKFGNLPFEYFGLAKQGSEIPFPRTLLLNSDLRPLKLIGREGKDFPSILWSAK